MYGSLFWFVSVVCVVGSVDVAAKMVPLKPRIIPYVFTCRFGLRSAPGDTSDLSTDTPPVGVKSGRVFSVYIFIAMSARVFDTLSAYGAVLAGLVTTGSYCLLYW